MSSKWPKEVSVLGKMYSIKVVANVDAAGSRGECDIRTKTIKIKKDTEQERWSALFHELAHAWLEEAKLTAYLDDDRIEELLVMTIEEQFLPMILQLVGRRAVLPE